MIWLLSSQLYSQQIILSDKKDTLIGFTIPQSRFLLTTYYQTNLYKTLDSLCEQQRVQQDSIIDSQKEMMKDQNSIILNKNEIIEAKDFQIKNLDVAIQEEKKRTRKQKVYKWCAIAGGIVTTSAMGYLYITK